MKYREIITESLSRVAYHFTGVPSANQIMKSGQFELSSTFGSVEEQYAPKGHPYFFSTTRTRLGGYHKIIGSHGVMFVLDGNWFNQRYPAGPVDYWLNRDPTRSHHRAHEAEDRVFSKTPTIPTDGVTAIHVYVREDAKVYIKAPARQLLIAAKKRGVPAYFYTDETAWRRFDTRNTANVDVLRGVDDKYGRVSTHPGYLLPWIELIKARDANQLGQKARGIQFGLVRAENPYYRNDIARGLATDLSNARKPDSGPDRQHAVNIIEYMRQHRLNNVPELVDHLAKKWRERGVAEGMIQEKRRRRRRRRTNAVYTGYGYWPAEVEGGGGDGGAG